MNYHLGADYFRDPDGTFVSQPKKYIDKLADTFKTLFNEDPPKGNKTHLDKNDQSAYNLSDMLSIHWDHPTVYPMILCSILGLTTLNSLLQYVNWLVWEVCSVN